jgi:hypothetical protein
MEKAVVIVGGHLVEHQEVINHFVVIIKYIKRRLCGVIDGNQEIKINQKNIWTIRI